MIEFIRLLEWGVTLPWKYENTPYEKVIDAHSIFSRDGFVDDFINFIEKAKVDQTGFQEKIVSIKTTTLGDIAHCFVVYEASIPNRPMPPQKGVDSFQLVKRNGQWLIASIVNEVPRPGSTIPEEISK